MRTRPLPVQLGARLAIGLLAAVYLWNLKIVSDKLFLSDGAWNPIFPSVHTSPLQQEATGESAWVGLDGNHTLSFEIPDSLNITLPPPKHRAATDESARNKHDGDDSLKLATTNSLNSTLPPPEHRVPAFIILGAQKSATQALRSYLSQHPLVHFPTAVIEPHFFDWGYNKKKSTQENQEAYIKLLNGKHDFDCRRKDCITGESTPSYLFATKHVPSRIKQVCPWAKLIVVLRDPVKRAFSQANMLIEKHEVKTSFREHFKFDRHWVKKVGLVSNKTLTVEEEDKAWNKYHKHHRVRKMMLGRGLYEIQLRAWFRYFPREQFLILKSEELDLNRTATMTRVFQFLGLHDFKLDKGKKVHAKKYTATMSDKTRTELYDFYRPYNKRLEALLGPEWKGIWEESS